MTLLELFTNKEDCLNLIKNEWLSTSDSFPDFLLEITNETKSENELYIKTICGDMQKQFRSNSKIPFVRKKQKQKTLNLIQDVLYKESIFGIHKSMDKKNIDAFQQELIEFLRHVRKFAPELSFGDIGQAIRNYIVYAMFKEINQVDLGFNMAGFGYSMLYPFTDNFIDNQNYSSKEKNEFNQMIRDKIEGKAVHPTSWHQSKTCELLQAIEAEYPREKDKTIFNFLLMMLDAQENSISQQNRDLPLDYEERLNVSIDKGGISVLIDRILIKKELTENDLLFYLCFGFFLQLADDLQDIKEDSELGHSTIFTVDLCFEQEKKLVNQLLNFLHHITDRYQANNDIFKNFILFSSYQLIYSSILRSKEYFSVEYLDKIEKYLIVTSPFLENMLSRKTEKMDEKYQDKYMNFLDLLIC